MTDEELLQRLAEFDEEMNAYEAALAVYERARAVYESAIAALNPPPAVRTSDRTNPR